MSDKKTYYKVKMPGMYLWGPGGIQYFVAPPKDKAEDDNGYHPLKKSFIGQNDDGKLAFVVRDPDGTRHVYPQAICKIQPSPTPEVKIVRVHDHTGPALLHCEVLWKSFTKNFRESIDTNPN